MSTSWKAGFGRRVITPDEPIWLAGYGARSRRSEKVIHDLFAKAMALDDGTAPPAVLVTADILGFSAGMSAFIQEQAASRFGLDPGRIVLSATHNHSSPINTGVLPFIYNLSDEDEHRVYTYTQFMMESVVAAIGAALDDLAPASLSFGQGLAGIGVNRRRARPGCRHLPAPVDPDVPVLTIRGDGHDIRGIIFGYACHTTVLSGYEICGDYAGFSQLKIEDYFPGATALFVPGCAGDINPLPRGNAGRAELHGQLLAEAVYDVVVDENQVVHGPLQIRQGHATLPYEKLPSRRDLEDELANLQTEEKWFLHQTTIVPPRQRLPETEARRIAKTLAANERKSILHQISRYETEGKLPASCGLPVSVWSFGSALTWIHLGGEPVVDYSLLLKKAYGWNHTWVSGYYHDLTCYIPSRRVLREGDYEGREGMREYGHPAPFAESIEQILLDTVDSLMPTGDGALSQP